MLKPQLLITEDGSHTLYVPELNEHYHSSHGAIQESMHVFINAGFNYVEKDTLNILEIGFGTGLNALLTLYESVNQSKKVYYETIEAFPLEEEVWKSLNYNTILQFNNDFFFNLHNAEWNKPVRINTNFSIKKINANLAEFIPEQKFDLIYFDAFAPSIQPDLWTLEVFQTMWNSLNAGGLLVTYSSKGSVKYNLRQVGFTVKRLNGANGKRHMIRAIKI